jgi:hypothetical protein
VGERAVISRLGKGEENTCKKNRKQREETGVRRMGILRRKQTSETWEN